MDLEPRANAAKLPLNVLSLDELRIMIQNALDNKEEFAINDIQDEIWVRISAGDNRHIREYGELIDSCQHAIASIGGEQI